MSCETLTPSSAVSVASKSWRAIVSSTRSNRPTANAIGFQIEVAQRCVGVVNVRALALVGAIAADEGERHQAAAAGAVGIVEACRQQQFPLVRDDEIPRRRWRWRKRGRVFGCSSRRGERQTSDADNDVILRLMILFLGWLRFSCSCSPARRSSSARVGCRSRQRHRLAARTICCCARVELARFVLRQPFGLGELRLCFRQIRRQRQGLLQRRERIEGASQCQQRRASRGKRQRIAATGALTQRDDRQCDRTIILVSAGSPRCTNPVPRPADCWLATGCRCACGSRTHPRCPAAGPTGTLAVPSGPWRSCKCQSVAPLRLRGRNPLLDRGVVRARARATRSIVSSALPRVAWLCTRASAFASRTCGSSGLSVERQVAGFEIRESVAAEEMMRQLRGFFGAIQSLEITLLSQHAACLPQFGLQAARLRPWNASPSSSTFTASSKQLSAISASASCRRASRSSGCLFQRLARGERRLRSA